MFRAIENFLYNFRDTLWEYPNDIFFGKNSSYTTFSKIYYNIRPFSHIILLIVILSLLSWGVSANIVDVLNINTNIYVEGVIVGTDTEGNIQQLARINPLINTNVQLEKDLNELIYESLIEVQQDGEIKPVLADLFVIEEGKEYQFKLEENIFWQDGEPITTKDVKATFDLLQELNNTPRTSTVFSRAVSKIELTVIDDRSFIFKLKSVIPAFFESISFKIMPSHYLDEIHVGNITLSDPIINRRPIGSGPYSLAKSDSNVVSLVKNKLYRADINFDEIHFKLFPDETSAIGALKNGQIHAITGISYDNIRYLKSENNINVLQSNILYNQYWAIYFNMGENGPDYFKDKKVRQAVSSAINRKLILKSLLDFGEIAKGPIPPGSFAYAKQNTYDYDVEKAKKLLTEAKWVIGEDGIMSKGDQRLSFDLLVVDNTDRINVAESIQADLAVVGIEVNITKKPLQQLINESIHPKNFDTLLYGVQTFNDPDRYELFHSSQIEHPGLNISSYTSVEEVLTVVDQKTVKIPEVDDVLDDGRKFIDKTRRAKEYERFLAILADETPVVFLYYPQEIYIVNKRVKNIDFENLNSIEDRFYNVTEWSIDY